MVTWADVKEGRVTLAELVTIHQYLTAKSDVEYFAMEDAREKNRRKYHGR